MCPLLRFEKSFWHYRSSHLRKHYNKFWKNLPICWQLTHLPQSDQKGGMWPRLETGITHAAVACSAWLPLSLQNQCFYLQYEANEMYKKKWVSLHLFLIGLVASWPLQISIMVSVLVQQSSVGANVAKHSFASVWNNKFLISQLRYKEKANESLGSYPVNLRQYVHVIQQISS